MSGSVRGPDGRTLLLFALAVLLGGSNFLAVRLSNLDLPPFWGAGLRFALASLGFLLLARAMRLPAPRGRALGAMAVYGLLSIAAFYGLMYWALLTVTAAVATVVLALVPLATLLLAASQRLEALLLGEPITTAGVAGAALVMVGVWVGALAPARAGGRRG